MIRISIAYFALVFAFAFVLGAIRTTLLVPLTGELVAVLIELPLVLAASWLIARRLLRGHGFGLAERGAIGLLALGLLLPVEMVLTMFMRDVGPGGWLESLSTPAGTVGLAGQAVFAAIPMFVRKA